MERRQQKQRDCEATGVMIHQLYLLVFHQQVSIKKLLIVVRILVVVGWTVDYLPHFSLPQTH